MFNVRHMPTPCVRKRCVQKTKIVLKRIRPLSTSKVTRGQLPVSLCYFSRVHSSVFAHLQLRTKEPITYVCISC